MADDDTTKKADKKTDKSPSESKGQVIDVSRPGSSKPSATSRPVIVGSGKILQDPMMKSSSENKDSHEDAQVKATTVSGEKTIQPLSTTSSDDSEVSDSSDSDDTAPASEKEDQPTPEESVATNDSADEPDSTDSEAKPESSTDPAKADEQSSESAIVDAVIDQTNSKKNTTKRETETTDDHIQTLIEEKKYFVTIGKARKKRLDTIVITMSILVIIATVVVVANQYEFISLW